jgi:hypothetical protein
MIIDKKDYPDIFVHNDDMNEDDRILFENIKWDKLNPNERTFFERMKEKEENEFAPSADIVISEHSNIDEIYLIRYYYSEYKIGRGLPGHRSANAIYSDSLAAMLKSDLFPLLGRHISFMAWLTKIEFNGVDYYGNSSFHHKLSTI